MIKIAFFDAKEYDRAFFNAANDGRFQIEYLDTKLNHTTAQLAQGFEVVCAFVNDTLDSTVLQTLREGGVRVIAMRCAGFNNVDLSAAKALSLPVFRVPAYSPYAVAEHAVGMLLTLNRKLHKAYVRTKDFNFSLTGLLGFDLHGKTTGVIGTGKIGKAFISICKGFGMNVIAYDAYPDTRSDIKYVSLDTLFRDSDIISLHCPLTKETRHLINRDSISKMKKGVYIVNTSRGGLVETGALLLALDNKVGGACLDVYEEEAGLFYEDNSTRYIQDEVLSLLVTRPNVLITSHQGYFTEDALTAIAETTLDNIENYLQSGDMTNAIEYTAT